MYLRRCQYVGVLVLSCFVACAGPTAVGERAPEARASGQGASTTASAPLTTTPAPTKPWPDRTVLPIQPSTFTGKIGPILKESDPAPWPQVVQAPEGAPNVLLILTDDVGFGASSTFGGPIPTPTFDRLAARGLKYNRFHTTALCSPSRAALITGRNHHTASTGIIMELSTPYPGYHSLMSKSVGTVGEVLRGNGYATAWFGKNHNVPDAQTSASGPFDLWPTGLGFDYFYGFLGADAHQFRPAVFENTRPVEPYLGKKDYHFDADLAEHAIGWIREQKSLAPKKPFFAYYTPGTAHAPHHAPKEWIAKFKGKFDQGWEKQREQTYENMKRMGVIPANAVLAPTPADYKRWDDLSPNMKKFSARTMECYAAALSHADYQMGRILDSVEQLGELDNTLVIFIQGDNGSSAEDPTGNGVTAELAVFANKVDDSEKFMNEHLDELGGPWMQNHFSHSWAHAMNAPFPWDKKIASHLGGTRNGMVISWPRRIKDVGAVRSQFAHLVDIVPTVLDAAQLPMPKSINGVEQVPLAGSSLMYTFDDAKAPSQHRTQYFEIIANRAIYHDGWMASTTPKRLPWVSTGKSSEDPIHEYPWELYNLDEDFTQTKDLAKQNPEKLKELQALFMSEAAKYQVLPVDDRYIERGDPKHRPQPNAGRTKFTYYPGTVRITEGMAPEMKNRSFKISAEFEVPKQGADGILMTQGGWFGGMSLMLLKGKPTFAYALSHQPEHKWKVQSPTKLGAGKHVVEADFQYAGGGAGKGGKVILSVDGKQVAQGDLPRTIPVRVSLDETLDIGVDTGTPVVRDYDVPFDFTGKLDHVTIELGD